MACGLADDGGAIETVNHAANITPTESVKSVVSIRFAHTQKVISVAEIKVLLRGCPGGEQNAREYAR